MWEAQVRNIPVLGQPRAKKIYEIPSQEKRLGVFMCLSFQTSWEA
jgi:hypothetical protein